MSKITPQRGPAKLKIDPCARSSKWEAVSLEAQRTFSNPIQIRVRQVQEGAEVPILVAKFESKQPSIKGVEPAAEVIVALHQSPDTPTIYVAEVKLPPGTYLVDLLRAKKAKGGTWERLPRSPFEIVIADAVSTTATTPRTTSPPKTTSPPQAQSKITSGGSVTDLKLATSAEPVPISKMTLPRLPSVPSASSSASSSPLSSGSFPYVDKDTVSSAIAAALNTKKLRSVETVISWTVIVQGLLACVYMGFLITKTLRE